MYDRDLFVDKIHEIYTKKKEISSLSAQRKITEEALAVEYKVAECNAAREQLIKDTQKLITPLMEEIKVLENNLLEI